MGKGIETLALTILLLNLSCFWNVVILQINRFGWTVLFAGTF